MKSCHPAAVETPGLGFLHPVACPAVEINIEIDGFP